MNRFSIVLLSAVLGQLSVVLYAQNPISPEGVYIADPTARVGQDGKMYIYGSLDVNTTNYCSKDYHVLSSGDLCNWTLHRNTFHWETTLYAPDLIYRNGTYYLYYDIPSGEEFVAVGDTPIGPFREGVKIEGPKQIDPNIFIDDDGQAYYFWGQFSAKGAKMNPDMKTLDLTTMRDGIVTEKDHGFHEGSYVIKRGTYYYYIYADISRRHRPTCLGYAMATSPLGPYEYKGIIIDNYGCDPESWNNHGSLVEYRGKWYVLYHRSTHGSQMMRKACIEPISFNADGTINEVEMTSQGAAAPLKAKKPVFAARACLMKGNARIQLMDGSKEHELLGGIKDGDMACWRYLDFGRSASRITMRVKAPFGGTVRIHADKADGPLLATVSVPSVADWQQVTSRINKTRGVHALWMEFTAPDTDKFPVNAKDSVLFQLDYFNFR